MFDSLNVLVKFGYGVPVEEALNLWMVKRRFQNRVPVPEVFGWRVEEGVVYIYMEPIRGPTLK